MQMAQQLQMRIPHLLLSISGAVQPPPQHKVLLATLLSLVFYLGLIATFALPLLLPYLPPATPYLAQLNRAMSAVRDNYLMFVALLFGCNVAAGQLMATGAFEVDVAGAEVWSKLHSGTLPSVDYLVSEIKRAASSR